MDGGVVSIPVAEAVLGSGLAAPAATGAMGAGLSAAGTGAAAGAGAGLGSGLSATAAGGGMGSLGGAIGTGGTMGLAASPTVATPLFGGPSAGLGTAATAANAPGMISPGFGKGAVAAPVGGQSTFQNAQMLRGLLNQQQRPRQPMMQPAPVQTTQVQMVPFGAISPYRR